MANCELIVPHCLEYGPAHDGQKLVRLIRKVKHVLMVKHCIDRIKDNTSAQYSLGRVSQSLYVYQLGLTPLQFFDEYQR